ncbi:MAG: hypothetical protein ABSC41_09685 [Acidimicrobiales bacterium]
MREGRRETNGLGYSLGVMMRKRQKFESKWINGPIVVTVRVPDGVVVESVAVGRSIFRWVFSKA